MPEKCCLRAFQFGFLFTAFLLAGCFGKEMPPASLQLHPETASRPLPAIQASFVEKYLNSQGQILDITVKDRRAYLTEAQKGIRIYDLSTFGFPQLGEFTYSEQITHFQGSGKNGFFLTDKGTLGLLDLSAPDKPQLVHRLQLAEKNLKQLLIDRDSIYILSLKQVVKIKLQEQQLVAVSSRNLPSGLLNDKMQIHDGKLYLAHYKGLEVFDLDAQAHFKKLSQHIFACPIEASIDLSFAVQEGILSCGSNIYHVDLTDADKILLSKAFSIRSSQLDAYKIGQGDSESTSESNQRSLPIRAVYAENKQFYVLSDDGFIKINLTNESLNVLDFVAALSQIDPFVQRWILRFEENLLISVNSQLAFMKMLPRTMAVERRDRYETPDRDRLQTHFFVQGKEVFFFTKSNQTATVMNVLRPAMNGLWQKTTHNLVNGYDLEFSDVWLSQNKLVIFKPESFACIAFPIDQEIPKFSQESPLYVQKVKDSFFLLNTESLSVYNQECQRSFFQALPPIQKVLGLFVDQNQAVFVLALSSEKKLKLFLFEQQEHPSMSVSEMTLSDSLADAEEILASFSFFEGSPSEEDKIKWLTGLTSPQKRLLYLHLPLRIKQNPSEWGSTLITIDWTQSESPRVASQVKMQSLGEKLDVIENQLFLTSKSGIHVFQLKDPFAPQKSALLRFGFEESRLWPDPDGGLIIEDMPEKSITRYAISVN
jgi:hypothetical protein